jgi:hypothetical protein
MIFFGEFLKNKDEDEIVEEIRVIKEDKSRDSEISF